MNCKPAASRSIQGQLISKSDEDFFIVVSSSIHVLSLS